MCTSGSWLGGGSSVPVVTTPPPRPLASLRRRRRLHPAWARRRPGRATASPRGRAAGSPCAAGSPNSPGQVEVAQRGVAVELEAVHLPGLALVPVGPGVHRHPRLDARIALVDVGLQDEPWCAPRVDATSANTWNRPVGAGHAVGGLLRLRGSGRVARALRRRRAAWASSRSRRRRRGSRSRAGPCRPRRRAATRRAGPAPPRRRGRAVVDDRVAELGLEAREHLRRRARRARSAATSVSSARRPLRRARRRFRLVSQRRSAPTARAPPLGRVLVPDRSCSITMPSMKASGRGGQPGT